MIDAAHRQQTLAQREAAEANDEKRQTKHRNDELRSDLRVILAQNAKAETTNSNRNPEANPTVNPKAEKKNQSLLGTVNELTSELSYQMDMHETEKVTLSLILSSILNLNPIWKATLSLTAQQDQQSLREEANEGIRAANERADRAEVMEELAHAKSMKLKQEATWRPHYNSSQRLRGMR